MLKNENFSGLKNKKVFKEIHGTTDKLQVGR